MKTLPADFPQPPNEADGVARYIAWMFQVLMWLMARAAAGDEWWKDGNEDQEILSPPREPGRFLHPAQIGRSDAAADGATSKEAPVNAAGVARKVSARQTGSHNTSADRPSLSAPTPPDLADRPDAARRDRTPVPPPRRPAGLAARRPSRFLQLRRVFHHPTLTARPKPREGPIQISSKTPTPSSHAYFVTIS
jgi:hypothetical protein